MTAPPEPPAADPQSAEPSVAERPTNVRWGVFGLAFGTSFLLYVHRYAFGVIKPKLKDEWNLDDAQLGWLDSAFATSLSLFQVPLGIAADAIGVHVVLTGLIFVWSVGLGMQAWAPTLTWMYAARAVFGAGQSAAYACVNRISRGWFPIAIRSTMQGAVGVLAGRLGGLGGNLLLATLMLGLWHLEWRTAVWILTAIGVAHGVLFALFFRNSPREHPLANAAEADLIEGVVPGTARTKVAAPKRMTVREMFRATSGRSLANLLALNSQTFLSAFADNVYSNWMPTFVIAVYGMKDTQMGIYASLPLLGGAAAGLIGGMLSDWWIRRTGDRRWARSGVAFVGKGTAAVILLAAILLGYDDPYAFCGALFFVKLFGDWNVTCSWGTVTDIGGRATATVFAFNNTISSIGQIVAPIVYGYVAKDYGWKPVFFIVAGAYALCAATWLLIDSRIPLMRENDDARAD